MDAQDTRWPKIALLCHLSPIMFTKIDGPVRHLLCDISKGLELPGYS